MSALWVRLFKLLKSILWAWMEEIALSSGVEAPEPAPWCHHVWLAMDGAMVGQGQPGQGSWYRQIRLAASQDKDLVPLLWQVEDIQPKYLTLVVAKSGKHLHKTLLLKENRKTNSLLFLFKIYFVHAFPCQETCLWEVGTDLLFIPLSSWDSLSQDQQPLWDLDRLG